MTKPIDLRPDHAAIVQEVLTRHLPAGVSVRVFGSRAKWTAKTFSDLDLAVKGKEKLPYKVMVELADAFEESDLPFRVDIVDWHTVTPSFQAVIDRDGVALLGAEPWETLTLAQAGVTLIDCVHATPKPAPAGYPYIAIPEMKDGRLDFASARKITAEDFRAWTKKAHPRKFDVVLSRRTNPGVTAPVGDQADFALGQNLVLLRANGERVAPEFLRWLVTSPQWWNQIQKFMNVGAVFDSLKCADVPKFELPIPPKGEQQRITFILTALDDKIELNRQMNETLEGMAQAIFRDWFVDFGPVRRKAAGETDAVAIMGGLTPDPARAAQLAVLFPDAFGDDGLPVGWTETAVGDLVKPQGGSTPSTADEALWSPPCHYWATPKDLSNMTDLALFDTARQISDAGLAKITSGLLPPGSVLLSSRAPIGYLAIAQVPVAINQGFIGLVPTAEVGSSYLYCWCKANMDKIVANANGSTFQEISKKNFRPITSALPADRRLIAEFGLVADPMFARLIAAATENRTLAETRDYLLPRLMSGTVRVDRESEAA